MVLKKSLEEGHIVTAYARNPTKIPFQHTNLHLIAGELKEKEKVDEAVRGADAVISLLGPKSPSKDTTIANGTQSILEAMQRHHVKRLIAAVSSSYRDPADKFQFGFDFSVWVLAVIGKSILRDIVKTGKQIVASHLDWTMVRLPKLSNGSAKGKLTVGYTGDGNVKFFSLTRQDLADFILTQLQDRTFLKKAPVVSN